MPKFIDMTGQRFGRLTIVSRAEKKSNTARWNCICDCGASVVVFGNCFKNGNTTSCGCFLREETAKRATTHGGSGTKEHRTWEAMKSRVNNKNNIGYKDYGGRGIAICDRWRDFKNFLADMGEKPEGKSLDRIDNDGDYTPENCRWATPKEQQNNKRNTVLITFNEVTKTRIEWASKTGLKQDTIRSRLKRGWSVESTLTKQLFHREMNRKQGVCWNGSNH